MITQSFSDKERFPAIRITIIALQILAFVLFLLVAVFAVFNMLTSPFIFQLNQIVFLILSGLVTSFLILAVSEFLQLLMNIEIHTFKTSLYIEKSMFSKPKSSTKKSSSAKKSKSKS